MAVELMVPIICIFGFSIRIMYIICIGICIGRIWEKHSDSFCFGFLARSHQAAPLIPSKKVLEHQITVCEPSIGKDVKHSSFFLCHDSLVCGLDGAVRPNELGNKFRIVSHVLDLVQFGEIFAQEVATITAAAIKKYSFTGNVFSSR
jgi:hypothetical protein